MSTPSQKISSASAVSSLSVRNEQLQKALAKLIVEDPSCSSVSETPAEEIPADQIKNLKANLTALPAALVAEGSIAMSGKAGKKKKKNKELHMATSNDGRIPWYKRPKTFQEFHTVQGVFSAALATSAVGAAAFGALNFQINNTDSFTYFSGVFDEYRIDMLEIQIQPVGLTEIFSPTNYGQYITVVDIDDASNPTSLNALYDYNSAICTNATQMHYHRWKPTYAVSAYQGAFTAYAVGTGFIDCAYGGVQHYGIKYGLGLSPGGAVTYEYSVRYHITYRALH